MENRVYIGFQFRLKGLGFPAKVQMQVKVCPKGATMCPLIVYLDLGNDFAGWIQNPKPTVFELGSRLVGRSRHEVFGQGHSGLVRGWIILVSGSTEETVVGPCLKDHGDFGHKKTTNPKP